MIAHSQILLVSCASHEIRLAAIVKVLERWSRMSLRCDWALVILPAAPACALLLTLLYCAVPQASIDHDEQLEADFGNVW